MSDLFYNLFYGLCYPPFVISHNPTVLGREHLKAFKGPMLVASNHTCPYDVPILMYYLPCKVDFVSTTEIIGSRAGWIYSRMNAFPLDQSRPDPKTVKEIINRLKRGRTVGIFPEGALCFQDKSVLHGGPLLPGVGRIARLAKVPLLPCAIENSLTFTRFRSWLPNQARYGVAFGEPMPPPDRSSGAEAITRYENELGDRIRALHADLLKAMRAMNTSLREIVGEVVSSADALASASEEVSATSQSLSQSASEQAASVEETSASLEQISSSINQNADNARTTDGMATKTAQQGEEGALNWRRGFSSASA